MEPSPLTQVSRPETFQPKIVQLYEALFQSPDPALDDHDDHEHSEGFWQEFFLLKPDPPSLRRVLQSLSADAMLHLQVNPSPAQRPSPILAAADSAVPPGARPAALLARN